MGLFRKVTDALTGADSAEEWRLLRDGTEAVGTILDATRTKQTTTDSGDGQRVFELRLRVTVPGQAPYEVEHRQWTLDSRPPTPGMSVRMRVDPAQPQNVTVDWRNPLPTVQGSGASVAKIVAEGVAARAVVRELFESGYETRDRDPLVGFELEVTVPGAAPFVARIAQPVPIARRLALAVGGELAVKVLTHDADGTAIDWAGSA